MLLYIDCTTWLLMFYLWFFFCARVSNQVAHAQSHRHVRGVGSFFFRDALEALAWDCCRFFLNRHWPETPARFLLSGLRLLQVFYFTGLRQLQGLFFKAGTGLRLLQGFLLRQVLAWDCCSLFFLAWDCGSFFFWPETAAVFFWPETAAVFFLAWDCCSFFSGLRLLQFFFWPEAAAVFFWPETAAFFFGLRPLQFFFWPETAAIFFWPETAAVFFWPETAAVFFCPETASVFFLAWDCCFFLGTYILFKFTNIVSKSRVAVG